jgi:hypothetical protein
VVVAEGGGDDAVVEGVALLLALRLLNAADTAACCVVFVGADAGWVAIVGGATDVGAVGLVENPQACSITVGGLLITAGVGKGGNGESEFEHIVSVVAESVGPSVAIGP